jgi:hypothetical protein
MFQAKIWSVDGEVQRDKMFSIEIFKQNLAKMSETDAQRLLDRTRYAAHTCTDLGLESAHLIPYMEILFEHVKSCMTGDK